LYLNSFSLIYDSRLIYVLLISFVGLCAVFFASLLSILVINLVMVYEYKVAFSVFWEVFVYSRRKHTFTPTLKFIRCAYKLMCTRNLSWCKDYELFFLFSIHNGVWSIARSQSPLYSLNILLHCV